MGFMAEASAIMAEACARGQDTANPKCRIQIQVGGTSQLETVVPDALCTRSDMCEAPQNKTGASSDPHNKTGQ
jgi:hypothetical protein